MDTRDDIDLARMMWDCLEYTYTHREYIEKLCVLIKKIGKSTNRRKLYDPEPLTNIINNNEHSIDATSSKKIGIMNL